MNKNDKAIWQEVGLTTLMKETKWTLKGRLQLKKNIHKIFKLNSKKNSACPITYTHRWVNIHRPKSCYSTILSAGYLGTWFWFANKHARIWPILQGIFLILKTFFLVVRGGYLLRYKIAGSPYELLSLVLKLLIYWTNLHRIFFRKYPN